MSVRALALAFSKHVGKSSTKSVLIAMADRADDVTWLCFPSRADIRSRTELDKKTVDLCLEELQAKNAIVDTGQRVGRTRQVKVWKLDLSVFPDAPNPHRDGLPSKDTPKRDGSSFSQKGTHFSAERYPKTGNGTTNGPSVNQHTPAVGENEIQDHITAAVWATGKDKIKNIVGFKVSIKNRLRKDGPTAEDMETLNLWKQQTQPVPAENPEEATRASEKKQRLASAKQCFVSMGVEQQKEIEFRFAMHLQTTNSFAYKAYCKSGLNSGTVAGAFYEWLIIELQ